ncbi:MAG: hypothetical protein ACKOWD_14560 [Rhodoferax sp.]
MCAVLRWAVLGMACTLAVACASLPSPPSDGRYTGELCVAQAARPADCGPARLTLASDVVLVQVSDMVYRLFLKGDQLDLTLMHDRVQVDAFSASHEWRGRHLRFADVARSVRYEVRFGALQGGVQ